MVFLHVGPIIPLCDIVWRLEIKWHTIIIQDIDLWMLLCIVFVTVQLFQSTIVYYILASRTLLFGKQKEGEEDGDEKTIQDEEDFMPQSNHFKRNLLLSQFNENTSQMDQSGSKENDHYVGKEQEYKFLDHHLHPNPAFGRIRMDSDSDPSHLNHQNFFVGRHERIGSELGINMKRQEDGEREEDGSRPFFRDSVQRIQNYVMFQNPEPRQQHMIQDASSPEYFSGPEYRMGIGRSGMIRSQRSPSIQSTVEGSVSRTSSQHSMRQHKRMLSTGVTDDHGSGIGMIMSQTNPKEIWQRGFRGMRSFMFGLNHQQNHDTVGVQTSPAPLPSTASSKTKEQEVSSHAARRVPSDHNNNSMVCNALLFILSRFFSSWFHPRNSAGSVGSSQPSNLHSLITLFPLSSFCSFLILSFPLLFHLLPPLSPHLVWCNE